MKRLAANLLLIILSAVYVFPIVWLIMISFKYQVDIFSIPPKWIFAPTLEHYRNVFLNSSVIDFLANSLIIAVGTTGLGLLVSLLAAYGCTHYASKISNRFIYSLFLLRMLPGVAVVVPIYLVASKTAMLDNYLTLILVHVCIVLPIAVLMLQNFILDIPKELEEAAMIDGCSRFGAFKRVVLPLMGPGLIATSVLSLIMSWNEFLFSMTLSGYSTQTLPVGVTAFMADKTINWGEIAAMGVVMIIPVAIFTLTVQKYLVKGLTMGAVKE
ncbi:MAG: carbohydrate ABC transporter permease [Syntrophomonadaceae bacterium]|nr:carbohydrate ABC transporter permease [Syntrophomonadaceae bacterium]